MAPARGMVGLWARNPVSLPGRLTKADKLDPSSALLFSCLDASFVRPFTLAHENLIRYKCGRGGVWVDKSSTEPPLRASLVSGGPGPIWKKSEVVELMPGGWKPVHTMVRRVSESPTIMGRKDVPGSPNVTWNHGSLESRGSAVAGRSRGPRSLPGWQLQVNAPLRP